MHHCCRRKQQGTSSPARDKPLVDISTNEFRSPDYEKLQNNLLSLSQNSKQSVAEKSGHFIIIDRSEEHTSELQSRLHLVCRLLLEKKNNMTHSTMRDEQRPD